MNQKELVYWQTVTANSCHRWVEDVNTRLNGHGILYYTGGESGIFINIEVEGNLKIGTYEEAIPHIGEAIFVVKAEKKYNNFDEAFQTACQFLGKKFLADMFSADQSREEILSEGVEVESIGTDPIIRM